MNFFPCLAGGVCEGGAHYRLVMLAGSKEGPDLIGDIELALGIAFQGGWLRPGLSQLDELG
jgi:hypothetical protein